MSSSQQPSSSSSLSLNNNPSSRARSNSSNRSSNSNGRNSKSTLQQVIEWYLRLLSKFPIATKMVTSAIVQFLGSLTAQKFILKLPKIDWHSVFKFVATGALVAPASHYWFQILDAIMQKLHPILEAVRKETGVPAKQMVSLGLDQLMWAPVLNCIFMSWLAIFDNQPDKIVYNIKRDLWPTMTKSWMVWPFASFVNLNYVPPELRVLFGNLVGFFWSIYLSYSLRSGRK